MRYDVSITKISSIGTDLCIMCFLMFDVKCWLGHFENTEVLIFGAALGFSHYLIHLISIDTILSKIDQYLDLPHQLSSFRVNMGGSKIQNVKIITNGALKYAKWWDNFKSNFKIYSELYLAYVLAQKLSKIG